MTCSPPNNIGATIDGHGIVGFLGMPVHFITLLHWGTGEKGVLACGHRDSFDAFNKYLLAKLADRRPILGQPVRLRVMSGHIVAIGHAAREDAWLTFTEMRGVRYAAAI